MGRKIGIFDSGLGGLIVARAIQRTMPEYDYVYLGDTKRVPYGNRSKETVFEFSKQAIEHLLYKEKCGIVIIACNTVSAQALKKLQREFPGRKILGVLIPAAEAAARFEKIGVIATLGTIASGSFPGEIKKINKEAQVFQNAAPMLVPLAEAGENKNVAPFIQKYIRPFAGKKLDALVLGCTHYPIFKREIAHSLRSLRGVGEKVTIISQDEVVPGKLRDYLSRHPEISKKLSRNRTVKILVTDQTQTIDDLTRKWFGKIKPKLIKL